MKRTTKRATTVLALAAVDLRLGLVAMGCAILLTLPVDRALVTRGIAPANWMRLRVPRGVRITAEDLAGADLLHGTPWHLREVLDLLDAQGAFSHRLRVAVIGGDRVDPALRAEAERRGIAVLGYYGAAELSLVAVDDGSGLRAFPGVRLRVRRGVLWVRTEQAARQLIGGASTLRREESENGAWLSVGDRARLSEDGVLALCGQRGHGPESLRRKALGASRQGPETVGVRR